MGYLRTITAARLINKAIDAFEHQHDGTTAEALVARALQMLAEENTDFARMHTGRARQLQAEIMLDRGEVDGCLEAYAAAESIFAGDRGSRQLYVRFLHDAALTLAGVGMYEAAKHYVAKGRAVAVGLSGPYEEDLKRIELGLEDCTAENYKSYKLRIGTFIKNASGSAENRTLLHKLAEANIQFGTAADIADAFEIVEVLYETSKDIEQQIISMTPISYGATRRLQPVPRPLLNATGDVLNGLTGKTPESLCALAYVVRSVALWSHGQTREALDASLRAVALSDSSAWRVGASVVRLITSDGAGNARFVALRLACELGEAEVAAELIETARLPALPDVSAAGRTVSVLNAGARPDKVLQRPLRPMHPVRVSGQSCLQSRYPKTLSLGDPLDLEESIYRIGGAGAWWWGGWLGPEGYRFWATRSPDGTFMCGCRGDSLDSPDSQLLKAAIAATPAMATDPNEVIAGEFSRSYFSEEMLSAQLGAMLVPEPLKAGLAPVAQDQSAPLTLVIAGNYLSLLPLPTLAPVEFGTGQPARLIELATIYMAPPVSMVAEVRTSRLADLPYPVAVVCTDPTSNLTHARLPHDALHVLGGRAVCQEYPRARPATRENLVQALRSLSSSAAVFAYAGHAESGAIGADLESSILLADNERLYADSLFARSGEGPAIPFPERVLLAACGSAGSAGSGRGEWLGIGAGVLASGAQEVIATAWPIFDTPFTRDFDESVLAMLKTSADVASGLRDLQLECLARWRSSTNDHSRGLRDPAEPLPLIWGSYQFLGLHRP